MKIKTLNTIGGRSLMLFLIALVATGCEKNGDVGIDKTRAPEVLVFELKPGYRYASTLIMDQTSTFAVGDKTMNTTTKMIMESEMGINPKTENGDRALTMSYTRVAMDNKTGDMAMRYDSDDPTTANGPLAMMGGMVGQPFTIVLDEFNEITDVKGIKEVQQKMDSNPALAQIGQIFADKDQIANMFNLWMTDAFPKDPVGTGDVWPLNTTMKIPTLGEMTMDGEFELTGFTEYKGHDCAIIDSVATMTIDTSKTGGMMAAMGFKLSGGKIKSRLYWDNKLGWMRGSDNTTEMTLSMTNPGTGERMEIPMNQTMTLEVTVTENTATPEESTESEEPSSETH